MRCQVHRSPQTTKAMTTTATAMLAAICKLRRSSYQPLCLKMPRKKSPNPRSKPRPRAVFINDSRKNAPDNPAQTSTAILNWRSFDPAWGDAGLVWRPLAAWGQVPGGIAVAWRSTLEVGRVSFWRGCHGQGRLGLYWGAPREQAPGGREVRYHHDVREVHR